MIDTIHAAYNLQHPVVPDGEPYSERRGTAPRESIILVQVDGLLGNLAQVEAPQQAGDGEKDLALGDNHAWADATAIEISMCEPRRGSSWICIPCPKHPMIPLCSVWKISALVGAQIIRKVPLRIKSFAVRIPALLVVHRVGIQYDDGTFGNELVTVDKILRSGMRGSEPERVMAALNFLDDGTYIGQALLVVDVRETISANDAVKFLLRLPLDFRIGWDESLKPLHN